MAEVSDRLVVVLEAKIDKLQDGIDKAVAKVGGGSKQIQKHIDETNSRWNKFLGENDPGKAIETTFSRARLGLIEEGGAKIGLFGNALEDLGPAGLAAAAGLLVVFEGISKIKEAAESIGQLKIEADKLGVPVEDLQKYQLIAAASGVSNEQLNQSFEGLTATLGKLKSGIRDERVKPFLDELGIGDADIAKAKNAGDLLDLLMSKFRAIQDPSERVQIADAFGFSSALPIMSKTKEQVDAITQAFHESGAVIGGEQAEAIERQNAALEEAHGIMQDKIRVDLLALAPLIGQLGLAWDSVAEKALGAIAATSQGFSQFEATAGRMANYKAPPGAGLGGQAAAVGENALGRFNTALTHPTTDALQMLGFYGGITQLGRPTDLFPSAEPRAASPSPQGELGSGGRTRAQIQNAGKAADDLAKAMAEFVTHTSHAADMTKRIAADRVLAGVSPTAPQTGQEAQLMAAARAQDAKFGEGLAKKAQSAAQKALEENKSSDDAISTAKKNQLKAEIALTGDLLADHQLKLQQLADDRDSKNRQVQQDAQLGKISGAAATTATGSNDKAYDSGVALENRKFTEAVADQSRTYTSDLAKYQIAHLTAQAEIATTTEAWAAETKEAFAEQQKVDRDSFVAATNKRTTELGANHLSPEEAKSVISGYDAQQADQSAKANRDTDLEALARKKAFADQLLGYNTSTLEAEASIATTAAQRRDIESQLLQARQKQARDELDRQIAAPGFQGDAGQLRTAQASQQAGETAQFNRQNENPTQQYADGLQDVNTQLEQVQVQGLQGLTDGLTEAITQTKSLGDAFHDVANSIISDLLKIAIQQSITLPLAGALGLTSGGSGGGVGGFLSSLFGGAKASSGLPALSIGPLADLPIPGFATGTDSAPGGLSLVGENGPELVNLAKGAQVIPNRLLSSLNRMTPTSVGRGPTTMNHSIKIDLTGANGDDTIRQISYAAAAQGTAQAIATSRSDMRKAQKAPGRDLTRY